MNAVMLERPVCGSTVRSLMPVEPQPRAAGEMQYPVDTTAPASARSYASWFIDRCSNVPRGLAEDAMLVVSEMVTNAHAATVHLADPTVIGLSLRLFADHLLIEVIDSSPEPPILKRADANALNGRGLHLVDSLSSEWGYFIYRNRKVVYCMLPVPAPDHKPEDDDNDHWI